MIASMVLLTSGCGAPTLDGSTDESLEATVGQVREALPIEHRARFDTALATVSLGGLDFADLLEPGAVTRKLADVRSMLDGRTAQGVFLLADSIREAARLERLRQARLEIEELEARRRDAADARARLAGFVVERSRFSIARQTFGTQPRIQLNVVNRTESPVSRAFFRGRLQSPGRSVPWLEEEFNYEIPGGIEPGESAAWNLAPNQFSAWGTRGAQAPSDAVLTVEVLRLDGPDGEPLFGGATWTQGDEERLAALVAAVDSVGR